MERQGHAVLAIHNLSCPLGSLRNILFMRQEFLFQAFGDFNCCSISYLAQVSTLLVSEAPVESRLPITSFVAGWYPDDFHTKRCKASNETPKTKQFTIPTAELEACLQAADHRLVVNRSRTGFSLPGSRGLI